MVLNLLTHFAAQSNYFFFQLSYAYFDFGSLNSLLENQLF